MNSISLKIGGVITFTAFVSLALVFANSPAYTRPGFSQPKVLDTVNKSPSLQFVEVPILLFGAPTLSGGAEGDCPGPYAGYVTYIKTNPFYGWAPSTNTTMTFIASDPSGRTDTKIQYVGEFVDNDCATTSVVIPYPPVSPMYRFAIYFPSNPPSTNYPIMLTGFNQ